MSEKRLKRIWSYWMRAVTIAVVILQAAAISQAAISRLYLNGSDDTSATVTITSGSNRMLIVCLDDEGEAPVSAVRVNGLDLTKVAEMVETYGTGNTTSMWVMLDADLPAAGTYSFIVVGGTAPSLAVTLWEGLAQQVPFGAAVNMSGSAEPNKSIATTVAPSAAGSLVLGTTGHGNENCEQFTPPSGWTRQWSVTPYSAFHAGAAMISPDTNNVTLTETITSTTCTYNRAAQVVAAFAPEAVVSGQYAYKKKITVDAAKVDGSCGSSLSDYPMLVKIDNDTDLRDHVQSSQGYDIVFQDSGGIQLYHEIEKYDALTGSLVAWVRVPTLSASSATEIWMYYGDGAVTSPTEQPAAVWSAGYAGVWHLNETPAGITDEMKDSTANANHGTAINMETGDLDPGKIGNGVNLDGSSEWIEAPDSTSLDVVGSEITLSAWVNSTADQNDDCGIVIKSDGSNYNYQLGIQAEDQVNFRVKTSTKTTYLTGSTVLQQNQWYYV